MSHIISVALHSSSSCPGQSKSYRRPRDFPHRRIRSLSLQLCEHSLSIFLLQDCWARAANTKQGARLPLPHWRSAMYSAPASMVARKVSILRHRADHLAISPHAQDHFSSTTSSSKVSRKTTSDLEASPGRQRSGRRSISEQHTSRGSEAMVQANVPPTLQNAIDGGLSC